MSEKTITIFGSGRAVSGNGAYSLAAETGRVLAEAGFAIANGGYGGTMLAAAKAAALTGGQVIGVTCSAFSGTANKYITRQIVTESLDERLDTLVKLGDGYVVLPGGTGTLLELAKIWELKNKGFLEKNKPIILVGKFWIPLVSLICTEDTDSRQYLLQAAGPEQLAEILSKYIQ